MRRLSALDAQFLAAEGGNFGAHYCALALYETGKRRPINAAQMRQLIRERIDQCPPLRWKVVTVPLGLDHPVFVDTNVDLDMHVTEEVLASPADDSTLADEVAAILSKPLDRDRPLWKLNVFHGLPGRTAVVFTLHHAALDGMAASQVFAMVLDVPGEKPSTVATSNPAREDEVPNRTALAIRGIASLSFLPARAVISASRALGHLDLVPVLRSLPGVHAVSSAVRGEIGAPRLDAPDTRFNTKLSDRRAVAFGTVPLADVKAIKDAFGITVNDVVIAMCAGALRRRLTASGDLPTHPLVAYLPVSTRRPGQEDPYGNSITSIIAPIPTHLSDARKRLSFAHETLAIAKRRSAEASPSLLSDANEFIPAPLFGLAARGLIELGASRYVRPPINLLISNVAGSPVGVSCAGAPLQAQYPLSVAFDGFALNITVVSYRDGLDVGIVGDAIALPDAWELISDIRDELGELLETARSSA